MTALPRGWVLPYWWHRQIDPGAPEHVPGARTTPPAGPLPRLGDLDPPPNRAHREVAVVASLGAARRATVDPRGAVRLEGAHWSLDWWVGADDGWRFPSQQPAVRQQSIDGAPVIETRLRVPGGEVLQRVWVGRSTQGGGAAATQAPARDLVMVEVHNATAGPLGVAFAIRPFHHLGRGSVTELAVDDDHHLRVEGRSALVLPRAVGRWAGGTAATGDAAARLLDGDGLEPPVGQVRCEEGLATLAVVFPLAHTTSLGVALPLADAREAPGWEGTSPGDATTVAPADAVARGWVAHRQRQVRLGLPSGALADRVADAASALLCSTVGEDVELAEGRRPDPEEEALVCGALDVLGLHEEAAAVLGSIEERIALDGYLGDRDGRLDANGALLCALGTHVALSGATDLAEALAGPIAKAAHWIDRKRHPRRARQAPRIGGALPDGPGPRWCGGTGTWMRDLSWSLAGMRRAGWLLERAGQFEASAALGPSLDLLEQEVEALVATAERAGVVAPQPDVGVDGRLAASIEVLLLGHGHLRPDAVAATLDALAEQVGEAGLVAEPASGNLSVVLTGLLALAEIAAARPVAVERVAAVAAATSAPHWWPEAVHPATRAGVAGDGWYPPGAAAVLLAVRAMLVAEGQDLPWWQPRRPDVDLMLLPVVPGEWLGHPVEVHGLPTSIGTLSFGLRWHDERPALLWELAPHEGPGFDRGTPPVLCCAGLDPAWQASGWSGDALLAPVAAGAR